MERGLDPLGHHRKAQGVTELDHGLDDRRILGVEAEAADEGPVDLDLLDGEPLQICERGVPSAEVVDGQVEAEVAQTAQGHRGQLGIGHEGGLGDLQPQGAGRHP